MRTILILALIGCGSDSVHDEVDCEGVWPGSITDQQCERACAAGALCDPSDVPCLAALPACKVKPESTGFPNCAPHYIATYESERGCCETDGPERTVRFTSCEGE